ncbi:MAG: DUF4097 domain-containing protein [Actinomycetales bacterium]|nr:DUF4097 domain-containing protein [Actinomycetales bacterium]
MTTAPPAPPAPSTRSGHSGASVPQEPLLLPGQRMTPSPGRDRPWRVLTVLAGSAVVLLVLVSLSLATAATWMTSRGYGDVPATTTLGSPESLTLASDIGAITVVPSLEVEEVTVALVAPGSTTLPAPDETVRARITHDTGPQRTALTVSQPERFIGLPWTRTLLDVLLLVPEGHELALDVQADVGDVGIDGEFTSLSVRSDVGDLDIGPVSVAEELVANSAVGDVRVEVASPAPKTVDISAAVGGIDLGLPADADGDVGVRTELGDVRVAIPGTVSWRVSAESELGDVTIDPALTGRGDTGEGSLTVASELGSITVTR